MKVSLGGDVDGIAITSITPKVAGAKAVTFEKGDWTVQYAKAEAGKKANELTTYATTFPNEAGTWYMKSTCTKTGDANGAVIYTKVTVDAAALTGTTVKFLGDEDGEYVDSLTFNDTNLTEKLEFTAPDGTKLVPGASDKDAPEGANCDIVYKKVGGSAALDEIVTAGDYVAEITGTGDYDGQRASVRFTVDALDLEGLHRRPGHHRRHLRADHRWHDHQRQARRRPRRPAQGRDGHLRQGILHRQRQVHRDRVRLFCCDCQGYCRG